MVVLVLNSVKAYKAGSYTYACALSNPSISCDSMVRNVTIHCAWLGLLLLTLTLVHTAAFRPLIQTSTAHASPGAFECGKPNGPCGIHIPANVTCKKGQGWCQPGYYCGRKETDPWGFSSGPELCKPVPKDCGKAGHPCCPSNADVPHDKTTPEDSKQRLPFCRDGSSCIYEESVLPDIYSSPYNGASGSIGCVAWPSNCGTSVGSCCGSFAPKMAVNPRKVFVRCQDDTKGKSMFCHYGDPKAPKIPGSELMHKPVGICYQNKPGCGIVGKTCCVQENTWSRGYHCEKNGSCIDPHGQGPGPYKLCVARK